MTNTNKLIRSIFLSRDFFYQRTAKLAEHIIHQVYFRIFQPIPFLEYKRSNDNFLPTHSARRPRREKGENAQRKFPLLLLGPCLEYEIPRRSHLYTRLHARSGESGESRSRGPALVNRDRRRASRATLWGCKQAESHAREFDGVRLLVFKAFCAPVGGGGEEGRYGCHVAETRQACRFTRHRHAISYPVQVHLSFLLSLPFFFVRFLVRPRRTKEFAFLRRIDAT